MKKPEFVALRFLVLVFILTNIQAASLPENKLEILSRLLNKRSHHHRNPVILILVPHSSSHKPLLRNSKNVITNEDENKPQDGTLDSIDKVKAKKFIKDILRTTGDEDDPLVKETNDKFLRALRSQCTKYSKCSVKCPERKKDKKSCQKSCREVFDYLMLCHPPGGKGKEKKKKKKNSCSESEDECGTTTKKDSCEVEDSCKEKSDSCEPTTCKPKNKRGRTMPPTWRMRLYDN